MKDPLTITVPEIEDTELQIIAICLQALSRLEPLAARRVITYIDGKTIERQYPGPAVGSAVEC